jgi:hypothetical protein
LFVCLCLFAAMMIVALVVVTVAVAHTHTHVIDLKLFGESSTLSSVRRSRLPSPSSSSNKRSQYRKVCNVIISCPRSIQRCMLLNPILCVYVCMCVTSSAKRGDFSRLTSAVAVNETYDRYFYHVLAGASGIGASTSATPISTTTTSSQTSSTYDLNSHSLSVVNYMYVAMETGEFAGIGTYDSRVWGDGQPVWTLFSGGIAVNFSSKAVWFGARDRYNDFCYTTYAAKVAPLSLDGLDRVDRVLIRDPLRVIRQSPCCSYDPKVQTWYQMAKKARKRVWTPVYR